MDFKSMHYAQEPLIICNVWNAASAVMAEKLGFSAIGTSSAACAASLGYEDGEVMNFDELWMIVKSIRKASSLPLSVDIEGGYSDNVEQIIKHLQSLIKLGVVGINIEDCKVIDGQRSLLDADKFSEIISAIKMQLKDRLFINARTDIYLVGEENPLKTTLQRADKYEKAGADGIFIPGLASETDISQICANVKLPINVMAWNQLPDFKKLNDLGVRRISMGNFLYHSGMKHIEQKLLAIKEEQSFNTIFNHD